MDQNKTFPLAAVFIISFVLALVHLFFLPRGMAPTNFWSAAEAVPLGAERGDFPLASGGGFFQNASQVGYLDPTGTVVFLRTVRGVVSGNDGLVSSFDPDTGRTVLIDREGVSDATFSQAPFVRHAYLLLLEDHRLGISLVDRFGKRLWSHQRSSPITAVDAGEGLIAAGDLAGVVELYDGMGTLVTRFQPGGSRYEVIYQVAVSNDGVWVLVLSGFEPKRLVVLKKGIREFIPVEHETVEDNRRFSSELRFIPPDFFAFTDLEGERLQIRRIRSPWKILQGVQGDVVYLTFDPENAVFDVVTWFQGHMEWVRLTKNGQVVSKVRMPSADPWAFILGEDFYYLRDGNLMRLKRGRL